MNLSADRLAGPCLLAGNEQLADAMSYALLPENGDYFLRADVFHQRQVLMVEMLLRKDRMTDRGT